MFPHSPNICWSVHPWQCTTNSHHFRKYMTRCQHLNWSTLLRNFWYTVIMCCNSLEDKLVFLLCSFLCKLRCVYPVNIYYNFRQLTTRRLISVYSVTFSNESIYAIKPINLMYRIITLFDDYWLSLPVALFIVLSYNTQSSTHMCNRSSGGRWQMRVVILNKDSCILMWCYHCFHICNTWQLYLTEKQMALC